MYLYLYDSMLKEKQYQSKLKSIENRLTDIGITGKIVRLTLLNNANSVLQEEVRRGAKTVVVVGNDKTFAGIIAHSAELPAVFGFIPVEESVFGALMGLNESEKSCDVISARKIEMLDIGWINNRYFLGQIEIEPASISIEYDYKFHVRAKQGKMGVTITNLFPYMWPVESGAGAADPKDGKLEAYLKPELRRGLFRKSASERASVFPFKEMIISGREPFLTITDGRESKEIKLNIKLAQSKLKMIVGKGRRF